MGVGSKGVAMWFVLLVAMFGNGMLRVFALQPRLGEDTARQVACLTGLVVIVALSGVFARAVPGATSHQLLEVGAMWLVLTVTFEFVFGRFASGMSWAELFEDYNLLRGRLWVLVLLGTVLSPWVWGIVLRRERR